MSDSVVIAIASGLGVAIGTWYTRRRGAKLEPKLLEILQAQPDLTARELAERAGVGNGWYATNRVLQALQLLVARKRVIGSVPAGTPLMRRVRETRYRLT
jgi:hypothetical protein